MKEKIMTHAILEAQEEERKRIAKDLHDSIIQNLISTIYKSEVILNYIDEDLVKAKLEIEILKDILKNTVNELRNTINDLMPMSLCDLGLNQAIIQLTRNIKKFTNIDFSLKINEDPYMIKPIIKLTLFRIIQEACNNVIKHANATLISISLNYYKDYVNLEIIDNGIGYKGESLNEDKILKSNGLGINIIKERVNLLSGSFQIDKNFKDGTRLIIKTPLKTDGENT